MKDHVHAQAGDPLFVSGTTNPTSLAGAISHLLPEADADGLPVEIRCIGVQAVNQAVKGIAIAAGHVATMGLRLTCIPQFFNTDMDGQEITAIKFIVTLREGGT